ncbi:helix-turn-helix domain-containing protein [Streptomyces sp. SID4919]|uniref:helix-turn-helix domain-containing protein n=1 Tax=unclassified Streptomyces TaxID=2593676 RepID=UPI000823C31F|nr:MULTISPECIES: helix-turn-helix transcriptional regulator [unclassified Streptomyces]MYY09479.1 helix-turn-helix domain-containing protein [Streptomyces sp. SID4919]SCK59903.1 Helix-turn-helix domain-containing protein [Streptomyces sp. AmelKG-E11A]
MSGKGVSTVPRRQLGRSLRQLRERAGVTLRDASQRFEWSETKTWRIETGRSPVRALDVQMMCGAYGADEAVTSALMELAREAKTPSWWQTFGDTVPVGFDVFAGLESAATRIDTYESDVMPGLLQTPDYVRAIVRTRLPDATPEDVESRVRFRTARQAILTGNRPPVLRAVLSETVLRRPMGEGPVMATQLAHLVYVAGLPGISIRVMTLAAAVHPGTFAGAFVVMHFPSPTGGIGEPTTVYGDTYTGGYYHDKEAEVAQYTQAFEGIWSTAQDEDTSRGVLADTARSYQSG